MAPSLDIRKRWQKEAVRKADLVSRRQPLAAAAAGSTTSRVVQSATARCGLPENPLQKDCATLVLETLVYWCPLPLSPVPAHPPTILLQQLLKAVVFFVGGIIVARNFGEAFAV